MDNWVVLKAPKNLKKKVICGAIILVTLFLLNPAPIFSLPITRSSSTPLPKYYSWGGLNHLEYSEAQKIEMNTFGMVLFIHGIKYDDSDSQKLFIKTELDYWEANYPNIHFYLVIIPPNSQFCVWDGNSEIAIQQSKQFITFAIAQNFQNIEGVAYDFEIPLWKWNSSNVIVTFPSESQHAQSIQIWENFFAWRNNQTKLFKVCAISFYWLMLDILNPLYTLHYLSNNPFLQIDDWDMIGVMIYRNWNEQPIGESCSDLQFYNQVSLVADLIKLRYGNCDKLNIFIGVMNNNTYSSISAIASDILICNAKGITSITLFQSITRLNCIGFFNSFGENALSLLNSTIAIQTNIPLTNILREGFTTIAPTGMVFLYFLYKSYIPVILICVFLYFIRQYFKRKVQ
jgi:hypothetical protein